MAATNGVVRIAAMSDVHCGKESVGSLAPVFAQVATQADVLVLCGDLTNFGKTSEAEILVRAIHAVAREHLATVGDLVDVDGTDVPSLLASLSDADALVHLRAFMHEAMGDDASDPQWVETCRDALVRRLGEPDRFASPHAGGGEEHPQRVEAVAVHRGCRQERPRGCRVPASARWSPPRCSARSRAAR